MSDKYNFDNLIIDGFDMEKATKLSSNFTKKSFSGLLAVSGAALLFFIPPLGATMLAIGVLSFLISPTQRLATRFLKKYHSALDIKKNHSLYELSLIYSMPIDELKADLTSLIEKGIIRLNPKSLNYVGRPQPKLRPINQPKEESNTDISYELSSIKQKRSLSQIVDFIEQMRRFRSKIAINDDINIYLNEIEQTMNSIYRCIESDEESIIHAGRLFSYYLPTLNKLLSAYTETTVNHSEDTKAKIREAVKTANTGFKKILGNFEQKSDIDVTSEIAAMEQIMAMEGIAETDSEEEALKFKAFQSETEN